MQTSYSTTPDYSTALTAQCAFWGATARRSALLTCHSTARTAQCAHRGAAARRSALQCPGYPQATTRHARRSAHTGELQHGAVRHSTPAMYNAHAKPGHYKAQQGAEQLGHDGNTRVTGTHHTHWHGHGALGVGQWA
jgi:hypothetical protein